MKKIVSLISLISFISFSCGSEDHAVEQTEQKHEMSHEEKEIAEMKEVAEKAKQQPQKNPYKDAQIDVRVYNNDTMKHDAKYTGFGYAILIYGEQQISQPHKPGMPGLNGFKTAADAKKVGEFVAYKIRNNIMPPAVSVQEMDSLGVLK